MVKDFEGLWNAVARNTNGARGNFMFAMLAMIFLEFTCRLCSADDTGRA
jgi:hypothetical protein